MTNLLYRNSSSPTVPVSTSTKGAPLTNLEVDGNFKSLSNDIGTKASTVYVDGEIDTVVSAVDTKAPIVSPAFTGTVSGITAAMVGAPSGSGTSTGTNTGDQDLSVKQDLLVSGTNIKTINGSTVLGTGNIVAASLGTNSFTGTQTGADNKLLQWALQDVGLVFVDKGNSGTTTQNIDYIDGSIQKITATGNFTITTSNWPPVGNWGALQLELINGGSFAITWPTISWIMPSGTTTTSISTYLGAVTGRTSFQTSGIDKIKLESSDSGVTIYGRFA